MRTSGERKFLLFDYYSKVASLVNSKKKNSTNKVDTLGVQCVLGDEPKEIAGPYFETRLIWKLDYPPLRQTHHLGPRHDEVIEHPHVDETERLLERLRQVLVRPARLGYS